MQKRRILFIHYHDIILKVLRLITIHLVTCEKPNMCVFDMVCVHVVRVYIHFCFQFFLYKFSCTLYTVSELMMYGIEPHSSRQYCVVCSWEMKKSASFFFFKLEQICNRMWIQIGATAFTETVLRVSVASKGRKAICQ